MRWLSLTGILTSLLCTQQLNAQPVFRKGAALVQGGGLSLNYRGKRLNLSLALGSTSVYRYGLIGPPVAGNWYGFASPWVAPAFAPPPVYFGANPFFLLPPPPPVIITPPVIVQQPIIIQQPIVIQQPVVQARADIPMEPVKVANPDRFIIIQPGMPPNNAVANIGKPNKEVDWGVRPAELPLAPRTAGAPQAEADRRIEDGKAAFARGEYGRALELFRSATLAAPADSMGYFLLAQAQFAVGKYDDAVASIVAGMELRRNWPGSRFDTRALYGANAGAFDFHVRNLRAAIENEPADPRLLFLLAVQLWFDGRREEARPLLDRAAQLARDPSPILAFNRN